MRTRLDRDRDDDAWDDGEEFLRWEQDQTQYPRPADRYDDLPRTGRGARLPLWWRITQWWRR